MQGGLGCRVQPLQKLPGPSFWVPPCKHPKGNSMELGNSSILWLRYVPTYRGNRDLPEDQRLSLEIRKLRSVDILAQAGLIENDDAAFAWRDEVLKDHLADPDYGALVKQLPAHILNGMRQFMDHTKGFRNFVFDGKEETDPARIFFNLAGNMAEADNLIIEIQNVIKKSASLEGEELKNFFWQCGTENSQPSIADSAPGEKAPVSVDTPTAGIA